MILKINFNFVICWILTLVALLYGLVYTQGTNMLVRFANYVGNI